MAESLAQPLHKDPGIQGRRRSHTPARCRDLGCLSEANQATGAVSPTLLTFHKWHQVVRPHAEQRSPQESQSAQQKMPVLLQVQLRWAGNVTRMENICMPKVVFFSKLQEGKRDRSVPRKRYKDQPERQLAQAGISHQSCQQEASDRDSWSSSVRNASCEFGAERHKAAKEKRRRQKERLASLQSLSQTFVCPKCGRGCATRIGLYSYQRARKDLLTTFPTISSVRDEPSSMLP